MTAPTRWVLLALLGLMAAGPARAAAQSLGINPDSDLPRWLRAWSALADRADLPRRLPGAGPIRSAFQDGAPRVGLFWTAGNPAGLSTDMPRERTDFGAAWAARRGSYKRPLDPGDASVLGANARSWRWITPGFSVLGQLRFDRETFDPGTRADATEPFATSPFVTTDTSGAAVRRTRAVLEGAAAWRIGAWSLGLTLGFEAREHTSTVSPVVRRIRVETPGVVVGAAHTIGSIEVGVFGRFRHRAETIRLAERAADARVYELIGWGEPPIVDVVLSYHRRREENVAGLGLVIGGQLGRNRFTAFAERNRLRERLWWQERNDPDQDRWDADGWRLGAAVQRPLGGAWLATVQAHVTLVDGDGWLAAGPDPVFTARERVADAEIELRRPPAAGGWALAAAIGFRAERRERRDERLGLPANVSAVVPMVRIEVGATVADRLFLSLGGQASSYAPTGTLPDPATRGPLFGYYYAPELILAASPARAWAGLISGRYRLSGTTSVWTSVRTERLSPGTRPANSPILLEGVRTATSLSAGVTIGPP